MAPAQPQGQDLGPFSSLAPARAPALPEALKEPDCAREVSERQLNEYMKGSFVQVSRNGGLGAPGRRAAWK